jgi:putative tryptophan/tyrosine transport system substrate-binding protein
MHFDQLKRREFITLLGGAAVVWPLAARAQQAGKLPTIGLWGPTTPSVGSQRVAAFVQRLRELGWIEGRTVAIEYRWAEGRNERAAEIAAEFVRLKVDVIVTQGTPSVIAAKQATSVIPIVFAAVGDPVGNGLVASLARPGSNVTGLSIQSTDSAAKKLELLREVVPGLRRAQCHEQCRCAGSHRTDHSWRRSVRRNRRQSDAARQPTIGFRLGASVSGHATGQARHRRVVRARPL